MMDLGRPSVRLFVALLVVALPPLVALSAIGVFAGSWLAERGYGAGTQLLIGAVFTIGWAGLVAVFAGRLMAGEARSMLELAEHGTTGSSEREAELSEAQRRLALTMEERNRQIGDLAEMVRVAPIAGEAAAVARSMAAAARQLTGDPTWSVVVLRGPDDTSLPPGSYPPDAVDPVEPLEDVHRWASTVESGGSLPGARHAIGPWGAFVVVDVAAGEELRAILLAPWEGRQTPSPAELNVLSLLGQHAATAIEHALLYARLRAQTDELNRMAALQTDFLRGVTHDLQTPLTRIGALAAELRAGVDDDAARADLDTIAHQADRLRRMVGQLLAVSRLEAGALTPAQEVFRAEPLVRRTWDALRADRPFALERAGADHLVVGDPDRLEQVLWAVFDNAVKYSPSGADVRVRLSARESPGTGLRSMIEISDEGAGMDRATLARAFEQFYRSADAQRLAPDGSGVGLYAARGLVRAMGGEMELESSLGVGTTVRLLLPAEEITAVDEGDFADETGVRARS